MVKQSLFVALLAAVSMWVSAEEMRRREPKTSPPGSAQVGFR